MDFPEHYTNRFHFKEQSPTSFMLSSRGDDLPTCASNAARLVSEYPDLQFTLSFNGIDVPVSQKSGDTEKHWSTLNDAGRNAFAQTPEGKAQKKFVDQFESSQARQRVSVHDALRDAADRSRHTLPMDIKRHVDSAIQMKLRAAAEWMSSNPDKDPWKSSADRHELENVIGWYGNQSELPIARKTLEELLQVIKKDGWDGLMEQIRDYHSPRRTNP